ncbi:MAG TPA: septal ring lytic transglycosylase RlpA family protein [Terriglobia bacterium]|nr:septal ring lytic transglycosylase RlpA family protein [Terriglobia bacterium]
MRNLAVGCTVAALVLLSAKSRAGPPAKFDGLSKVSLLRTQSGIASWYGEAFQGIPTASGELFDMNRLTAAHPTLPLGSRIIVTNLRNHRSVVVRVNDRGPLVPGRLVDVSKAAARRLGFVGAGVARVRVRTLSLPGSHRQVGFETLGSCAALKR